MCMLSTNEAGVAGDTGSGQRRPGSCKSLLSTSVVVHCSPILRILEPVCVKSWHDADTALLAGCALIDRKDSCCNGAANTDRAGLLSYEKFLPRAFNEMIANLEEVAVTGA